MDIMKIAAELFMNRVSGGGGLSTDSVISAFKGLLGGDGGNLDLMGLVSKFKGAGLESVVSSWLGDGSNEGIDAGQVINALGEGEVSKFAGTLGMGTREAAEGLAGTLPELMDKASSGGALLDSVGGIGGALGMAKKLFS